MNRAESIERLRREKFDVLVIGGGIVGCGVALDAASRGLKVALVERRDFSSGTSSKSSKLIHGGLRYLRQGRFKVTFESSREKAVLRKAAAHLVEDVRFVLPLWDTAWSPLAGLGLLIYDAAAGFPRGRLHRRLAPAEALREVPGLRARGLRCAYLYYDARADDSRLVLHVARRAAEMGAVLANYTEVIGFLKSGGRIAGVRTSGFEIAADRVVNAAGVWCDEVRAMDDPRSAPLVRPTKGVHLVVPLARLGLRTAMILPSPADRRVVFAIPFGSRALLGTTDTDYRGVPDKPRAAVEDVEYILGAVNACFPSAGLTVSDVCCTFAGLRSLVGGGESAPSAVSRDHRILESHSGLVTVAGGKLTTYRLMAEQVVDRLTRRPCRTRRMDLRPADVADGTPLCDDPPHVWGEVDWAVEREMALTLSDVLVRRLRLAVYAEDRGMGVARRVAERMAARLGWDPREVARQLESYERELEEEYPPGAAFARGASVNAGPADPTGG